MQPLSQKSKSRNTTIATSIRTKTAPMQLPFLCEAKRLACTPQPASGRSISYYLSGYVSYPVWMRGPLARKSNQTSTHTHTNILLKCYGENASEASGRALVLVYVCVDPSPQDRPNVSPRKLGERAIASCFARLLPQRGDTLASTLKCTTGDTICQARIMDVLTGVFCSI